MTSKPSTGSSFAYYEAYLQSVDDVGNKKPRSHKNENHEGKAKERILDSPESKSALTAISNPIYPVLNETSTVNSSTSEISASDIVGDYDNYMGETEPLSVGAESLKDLSQLEGEKLGVPSGKVKSADDRVNDIETGLEDLQLQRNNIDLKGDDKSDKNGKDDNEHEDEEKSHDFARNSGNSDQIKNSFGSVDGDNSDFDDNIVDDYGDDISIDEHNRKAASKHDSDMHLQDLSAENEAKMHNTTENVTTDAQSNSSEYASNSELDASSGNSDEEEDGDTYSFLPNDDASSTLDHHLSNPSTGSLSTGVISRSVTEKDDALPETQLPDSSDFRDKFIRVNTMDTVQTTIKDGTAATLTSGTVSTAISDEGVASVSEQIPQPSSVNEVEKSDETTVRRNLNEDSKEREETVNSSMLEPLPEGEEYDNTKRSSTTTEDTTRNSGVTWESFDTKESSALSVSSSYSSGKAAPHDYSDWKIPEMPSISIAAIMALPTFEERLTALKKGRNDLLNFDSGLETFLRETVKIGNRPALSKDSEMGPHVRSAYTNSQRAHHRYGSSSVGAVTSELASDIFRKSTVLKQKGRNFFKKIHLKAAK